MGIGLLGQKLGMSQLYTEQGEVIPVTVIQAGPCCVLQVKTMERDGYEAVQLGYKDKPRRLARKSERGHVANIDSKRQKAAVAAGVEVAKKADCEPKRFIREFRVPVEGFEVGQNYDVEVFNDVVAVDVTARSKGRGYAGAMKRHNFSGQRATHGVKKCHRHLGSTGCSAYPSRTPKGKRMPGHYGNAKCTVRNQKVVVVDKENNLLVIRGAVPGPIGSYVAIRPTNKLPAPKHNKWRLA
ncbi:MAG: 50S ribosomal protein L3 [Thermoguttaceae bacterium]|jgi:large subunit ribosomal protein L3|nr:50S ribosomal protein L3 [Thermoguttaceae bacterium]MBQ7815523.1 50S ribosomal protein L3 [Thermoguttaceae bacterium]MBQ9798877.1 50S ribosomal protein L3 [Thermoguttaceae bacterium]